MISFEIRIEDDIDNDIDNRFHLSFPSNIPFSEMRKAIELKIGYQHIFFRGIKNNFNNDRIIKNLFRYKFNIIKINVPNGGVLPILDIYGKQKINIPNGGALPILDIYGKQVLANVIIDKNEKNNFEICIGLLNSNKFLINIIEKSTYLKVKKYILMKKK